LDLRAVGAVGFDVNLNAMPFSVLNYLHNVSHDIERGNNVPRSVMPCLFT
jgi:hypothetical protein